MDKDLLKRKIKALLHDPPEKAGILMQQSEGHEWYAEQYIQQLIGEPFNKSENDFDLVKSGDQIASGADRYNFPKEYGEAGKSLVVKFFDDPVLRHPLSGATIRLASREAGDALIADMQQTVRLALEEIKAQHGNEPDEYTRLKKYYLSLWRNLPALLEKKQQGAADFGGLWHRMPAETRMPDHAIWEHLSLVSALVGAQIGGKGAVGNTSLVLFTLGPIQRFVTAARKTTDLWAGSYMLSYLSWQAMQVICDEYGPDAIVFPDLHGQPLVDLWLQQKGVTPEGMGRNFSVATFPNRFLAFLPAEAVTELMPVVEAKVRDTLVDIGAFAMRKIGVDPAKWEDQLANYLECYWAAVPFKRFGAPKDQQNQGEPLLEAFRQMYPAPFVWDNAEANAIIRALDIHAKHTNLGAFYGRIYSALDAVMQSRKSIRDFGFVQDSGYRCALHPELSAIVPDPVCKPDEVRTFWENKAAHTKMPGRIKKGERLSAVGLAKRFFPRFLEEKVFSKARTQLDIDFDIDTQFPSTSSFAVADYKRDVLLKIKAGGATGVALKTAVNKFVEVLARYHRSPGNPVKIPWESHIGYIEALAQSCEIKDFSRLGGNWFFAEAYDLDQLNKEYFTANEAGEPEGLFKLEDVQLLNQSLQKLLQATDACGIERPSKYYTVIALDGDQMGRWLSGDKNVAFKDTLHPEIIKKILAFTEEGKYAEWGKLIGSSDIKRPSSPSLHLAISRALKYFSLQSVQDIVENQHCGRVIYAGGDDVLAFVSFRDGLTVSHKLRAAFSGQLNAEGEVEWERMQPATLTPEDFYNMGGHASASAGLVYAHRQQSLRHVLAVARAAEKWAKGKGDDAFTLARNALGIRAIKRNGETISTGLTWYTPDKQDQVEALEKTIALFRSGVLSPAFVYDLERALPGLSGFDDVQPALHEAMRLFNRHTELKNLYLANADAMLGWLLSQEDESSERNGQSDELRDLAFSMTIAPILQGQYENEKHMLREKRRKAVCPPAIYDKINPAKNAVHRTVSLLDAALFVGKGGAR